MYTIRGSDNLGWALPSFGPNLTNIYRRIRKLKPGRVLAREVGLDPDRAKDAELDVGPKSNLPLGLTPLTLALLAGGAFLLLNRRR